VGELSGVFAKKDTKDSKARGRKKVKDEDSFSNSKDGNEEKPK
jgi:hypothetical protein